MDPHNQNSRYLLSAANEQEEYTQAPAEYIKNLFDNYAVQYDEHLCQTLHYILPEKIGELLDKNLSSKKETVLDLGCGTGLLAPYLKPHFEELWGVDLSQKMLDNAEKTGFYTQLICEDIQTFFNQTNQLYSSAKSIFDAIIAAEVFEYFGDLSDLFSVIKSHLKPNGLFIFSIELSEKNKDFTLQETARFAHRADYIHRLAEKNHLTILQEISLSARLQNDKPLNSSLFIMSGN
jgi:predicted TPR repeat methyltransferase